MGYSRYVYIVFYFPAVSFKLKTDQRMLGKHAACNLASKCQLEWTMKINVDYNWTIIGVGLIQLNRALLWFEHLPA